MTHLRLIQGGAPSCSGPCSQGDQPCKTPHACRLPEAEPDTYSPTPFFRYALVIAVVAVAAIAAGVVVFHK